MTLGTAGRPALEAGLAGRTADDNKTTMGAVADPVNFCAGHGRETAPPGGIAAARDDKA